MRVRSSWVLVRFDAGSCLSPIASNNGVLIALSSLGFLQSGKAICCILDLAAKSTFDINRFLVFLWFSDFALTAFLSLGHDQTSFR